MPFSSAPIINILRQEIASTFLPLDDHNARRVAQYSQELLTSLLVKQQQLPAIQTNALRQYAELLPALSAQLSSHPQGSILIPELTIALNDHTDYPRAEAALQRAVQLLAATPETTLSPETAIIRKTRATPEAKELLHKIATINSSCQQAFLDAVGAADHQTLNSQQTGPTCLSETQTAALQVYLRQQFPQEPSLTLSGSKLIVGGGSKHTYFVYLQNNVALPATLVLRIDKSEGVVGATVADEFALNVAVHKAGLPVPEPIRLEHDSAILGAPFVLVSCISGHNIGDWFDVWESSREFAAGLAQVLAKLHHMPVEGIAQQLPGANTSTRDHITRQLDTMENTWRTVAGPLILMEQAYQWLRANLHLADGQRSVIHCDVGCHNMLGENDHLTALLDWETAVVGNPAQDLTNSETNIVQMMPWEDYLEAYRNAGGTVPPQEQIDFYRLFNAVFRIHWLFIARAYLNAGMTNSIVHAYASERLIMKCEANLHRQLKQLYTGGAC